MKKVLIIGSGGAGKTTLARTVSTIFNLPIIHLDSLYWKPGWIESSKQEWQNTVSDLVQTEAWVMDGNYSGTLNLRMAACDTLIFLDMSRWVCLRSVLTRLLAYHGRSRPDMPEGCPERLSWDFLRWIWNYPKRGRAIVTARLREYAAEKEVIVLRSRREVADFIGKLRVTMAFTHASKLPTKNA